MVSLRWDDGEQCFILNNYSKISRLQGGYTGDFSENHHNAGSVRLGDIRSALRAAYRSTKKAARFVVRDDSKDLSVRRLAQYYELVDDLSDEELLLYISIPYDEEPNFDRVASFLTPLVHAFSCDLFGLRIYEDNILSLEILLSEELSVSDMSRFIELILRFLADPSARLNSPMGAYLCIAMGNANMLLGQIEGEWFDAKRAHYGLDSPQEKQELALDVASFANATDGGIIVIGLATSKDSNRRDVVASISGCNTDTVDIDRYLAVIYEKVVPPIVGLSIEVSECQGKLLMTILIPAQPDEIKPFVVRYGAINSGKSRGVAVAIPHRLGDRKWNMPAETVHSLLVAARVALRQPLNRYDDV